MWSELAKDAYKFYEDNGLKPFKHPDEKNNFYLTHRMVRDYKTRFCENYRKKHNTPIKDDTELFNNFLATNYEP